MTAKEREEIENGVLPLLGLLELHNIPEKVQGYDRDLGKELIRRMNTARQTIRGSSNSLEPLAANLTKVFQAARKFIDNQAAHVTADPQCFDDLEEAVIKTTGLGSG